MLHDLMSLRAARAPHPRFALSSPKLGRGGGQEERRGESSQTGEAAKDSRAGGGGMAKEIIFPVGDAPEGGYLARALGCSIFAGGDTWDELKQAIRDGVHCHFDEGKRPDLIRLHMVREEVVAA